MILLTLICGTLGLIWWVYVVFAYRPRSLAGATVVVTGACSEVGRRLCVQLYARGAHVIAWDYSRIKLQELQLEVQRVAVSAGAGSDSTFTFAAVDASSRVQLQRAAKEVDGPVDIIINAAHTCPTKPLHDRSDDSVDRVFQANLVSPLLVVRQFLPSLLATAERGGSQRHARRRDDYAQVVNIVCAAGNYAVAADAPDYAASQWGMVGMHYSMRAWIEQERRALTQPPHSGDSETTGGKSKGVANTSGAAGVSGSANGRGGLHHARGVRTTLLCLNDIQNGIPTALNSMLAPASAMLSGAVTSFSSPNTASGPDTPSRDDASTNGSGGSNARVVRPASSSHEGYAATLQKRSAELDRAVACCITAICRGQERYCYGASWRTTVLYPLVMTCPLPWAERMLRWLQRSSSTAMLTES
jgi:NAD(P)-dependent dehydrogenase (short-subunit alcohol dehydrogenase family)